MSASTAAASASALQGAAGLAPAALNAINIMAQGSYGTTRDVLKHQIWDTRTFAVTPADAQMFSQPIGAPWVVGSKTKNETNMTDSGKIPTGQSFLVNEIGVALISAYDPLTTGAITGWKNSALLAQSYINILQNSVFEIRITGREYDFQVHGRQFLPSLSLNGYQASGVGGIMSRNGDVITGGFIKLAPTPIVLDSQVNFSVVQLTSMANTTIQAAAITNSYAQLYYANCTMQITLAGILTRAK